MSAGLQPREYFRVIFRHKWKVLGFVTVVMLATWAALVFWPRSYQSEAKLMILVGRESVSLDPTATTSETLMLQKTQEDEINSALEVLHSRHLAELVVDELGPEHILANSNAETGEAGDSSQSHASAGAQVTAALDTAMDWCLTNSHVRDSVSERERAIRQLQDQLVIYAPKQSTVITINYQSKSPQLAQETTAEVTNTYLREHLRISKTQGSREFFGEQSAQLAKDLQNKTDELNAFRKTHGIVSISANQELLREQLSGIEAELRSTSVMLDTSGAEITDLQKKLSQLEPELVSAKIGSADPTWSKMRDRMFALEIQEKELASKYTEEHPLLKHVQNQLAEVREKFDAGEENRVDETRKPNPIAQSLNEKLLSMKAKVAGAKSGIASLETRKQEVLAKLDALIDLEDQVTQMERQIAIVESNFFNHQEKLEEARIIDALGTEKISNVNIVQPATFEEKPVSPKKVTIAALALFVALFGGVGLAFAAEAMDSTLRTTEQAESQLELPVLSSIPAGVRSRDLLKSLSSATPTDVLDVNCKSLLQQILCTGEQPQASTTLGVLSVNADSGGNTLASRLAIVASRDLGLSTLLVETDNEEKCVSRAFRLNGSPGLRELMANEAAESDCIQQLGTANLAVMSSASQDSLGALTLDPRQVAARLDSLRDQYDLVIVDMPPAASSTDGVLLSALLDHVLLVVQSEKTVGKAAKRAVDQLLRSHAKLSGIVLTNAREYLPRWLSGMV